MKLPRDWVSLAPNGIGHQKPNHYKEMAKVAWAVKGNGRKAWKILSEGVCDGCALGVAGFHDWTLDGVHLCTTRLRLLEVNCAEPFDHTVLGDVSWLRNLSSTELRDLGRLAHPMRRRRGEPGFRRISWDEALDAVAGAIRDSGGERTAIYLTSRGLTNEVYYAAAKAARAMGVASIDSAARTCHAPSTVGLKQTIGVAASTCSMQDVLETDLVVLWGTNVANNQPVFTKYLYLARKRGARVVVVNPYLEPGLERYWVPSNIESALFGTKLCDLHVPVRPEGDVALANAVLHRLVERGDVGREWIAAHTEGWDELAAHLATLDQSALLAQAGVDEATFERFVDLYANARSAILIWSMGITQHSHGVDGVRAIVNVGLARGNVGRDGAGLMPIRGHSGVQGGAEMGAYATAFPGGEPVDDEHAEIWAKRWGFAVSGQVGLTAPEIVEAAERGDLDVLFIDGSNLLEVMPEPPRVAVALARVPLRVHQDIVLTSQMFADGDDVILLPAATRYEQEGGGTSTTTERQIAYSPQVADPPGEARSEWRIFADLAARVRADLSRPLRLGRQPGPARRDRRPRADVRRRRGPRAGRRRRAVRRSPPVPRRSLPDPVRSWPLLGPRPRTDRARPRRVVRVDAAGQAVQLDGARRHRPAHRVPGATPSTSTSTTPACSGVADGDRMTLTSGAGSFEGRAKLVRLPARTLQVHWPEGNVLLAAGPAHREPMSRVPDYNAIVTVTVGRS